mmetsp:Transcript_37649/g.68811  ORF Transcript_37649/g.68811 Transcript_37649/m.68811 type:complete len:710 (-) Transcript_37649:240-2369(-)
MFNLRFEKALLFAVLSTSSLCTSTGSLADNTGSSNVARPEDKSNATFGGVTLQAPIPRQLADEAGPSVLTFSCPKVRTSPQNGKKGKDRGPGVDKFWCQFIVPASGCLIDMNWRWRGKGSASRAGVGVVKWYAADVSGISDDSASLQSSDYSEPAFFVSGGKQLNFYYNAGDGYGNFIVIKEFVGHCSLPEPSAAPSVTPAPTVSQVPSPIPTPFYCPDDTWTWGGQEAAPHSSQEKCYKRVGKGSQFECQKKHCEPLGAALACPMSVEERTFIQNAAGGGWIGLFQSTCDGKYNDGAKSGWEWVNGCSSDYRKWGEDEPNTGFGHWHCVKQGGPKKIWTTASCEEDTNACICEWPSAPATSRFGDFKTSHQKQKSLPSIYCFTAWLVYLICALGQLGAWISLTEIDEGSPSSEVYERNQRHNRLVRDLCRKAHTGTPPLRGLFSPEAGSWVACIALVWNLVMVAGLCLYWQHGFAETIPCRGLFDKHPIAGYVCLAFAGLFAAPGMWVIWDYKKLILRAQKASAEPEIELSASENWASQASRIIGHPSSSLDVVPATVLDHINEPVSNEGIPNEDVIQCRVVVDVEIGTLLKIGNGGHNEEEVVEEEKEGEEEEEEEMEEENEEEEGVQPFRRQQRVDGVLASTNCEGGCCSSIVADVETQNIIWTSETSVTNPEVQQVLVETAGQQIPAVGPEFQLGAAELPPSPPP